mgnify:FL=1
MSEAIRWGGDDAFTHMLIVGPSRCGKTATILKPMIYQMLLEKARGKKLGLSVIEPKGDVAEMVAEMSKGMGIPYVYIDPLKENGHKLNVMQGETDDVAEATVAVLKSMFGRQEAFFSHVQELSARNITKLLKELYGDNIDLLDLVRTLRDPKLLRREVEKIKAEQGFTDLVDFFENELLGRYQEKYQQFVIGLRAQLENISSNKYLKRVISGKSDIDLDEHMEKGGVLAVNTEMGRLGTAGDAFGRFVIMHLQNATFRRPGTERTRVPHFLICDEYGRYINPDVERFLSAAAEYRTAGIFAIQSLGQLEVESGNISSRAMKQAIMTSCRNKIAFGGLSANDAKEFAEEFGKDRVVQRQSTYKHRVLVPPIFPDSYRDTEKEEYRYYYTRLMDGMPRFHFIYKLLQNGTPTEPRMGKGDFVPRDWKERLNGNSTVEKEGARAYVKRRLKGLQELLFQKRPVADEEDDDHVEEVEKESVWAMYDEPGETNEVSTEPEGEMGNETFSIKDVQPEIPQAEYERVATQEQSDDAPTPLDEQTEPKKREPVVAAEEDSFWT